jgi:hypothetical protein
MLLRKSWREKPSRKIIALGMGCFSCGAAAAAVGTSWRILPDVLSGALVGLAGVLLGVSIVINIRGLKRYRAEQARS